MSTNRKEKTKQISVPESVHVHIVDYRNLYKSLDAEGQLEARALLFQLTEKLTEKQRKG